MLGVVLLSGCQTVDPYVQHAGKEPLLKDICLKNRVDWELDPVSQVITLNRDGVEARALVGSNVILVDGQKIILSGKIERKNNAIVVPADFEQKVIGSAWSRTPSVAGGTYALKPFRVIMIDAGHGGKDPGAIGYHGSQEKDVVLDIAKRLHSNLTRRGFKVLMTRDDDRFISLEERTAMASRAQADLFVSLHANASPSRQARGVEVYYSKDLDRLSRQEEQRIANENTVFKGFQREPSRIVDGILSDMLYTRKQEISPRLALSVANDMASNTRAENRGHKSARYFVLRNTLVPAILVEIGFVSNPQEEKMLNDRSYRQKVADAITRSIVSYNDG